MQRELCRIHGARMPYVDNQMKKQVEEQAAAEAVVATAVKVHGDQVCRYFHSPHRSAASVSC